MDAIFFESPAAFRAWLEQHHHRAGELWVGFHRKGSGRPSITWPEAVAEALCFGWIDGVRKGLDGSSYVIRFTPRKPGSTWSAVNVKLFSQLLERGLVQPAGLRAFEARDPAKTAIYSYEQRAAGLEEAYERRFREHDPRAWAFFESQAPSYRRAAGWWVTSAKREATRLRRLAQLIDDSANGRRVAPLAGPRNRQQAG